MSWMIVRVRGTIHARRDVTETLRFLHLTRPNHATVVPEEASYRGMITKVQGYVTWGEADGATVGRLLETRGELTDGRRVSPETLSEAGHDLAALAKEVTGHGLPTAPGLKPLFRLKAPRGGWRSTKKPFARGGALGYRGEKINELVQRML
jgi:large subunit ribosomal protein L30